MVKSVSSCCVRGSRVVSNPVTYYHLITQGKIKSPFLQNQLTNRTASGIIRFINLII